MAMRFDQFKHVFGKEQRIKLAIAFADRHIERVFKANSATGQRRF